MWLLKKRKYGEFRDSCSQAGFLGPYESGDEILGMDDEELRKTGGSYRRIAKRMRHFVRAGNLILNGTKTHPGRRDILATNRDDPRDSVWEELGVSKIEDGRFEFVDYVGGNIIRQVCPFRGCGHEWNFDYIWLNTETGRRLWVNEGTAHLAAKHRFLEKSPGYGISAGEFYEHFMPVGRQSLMGLRKRLEQYQERVRDIERGKVI